MLTIFLLALLAGLPTVLLMLPGPRRTTPAPPPPCLTRRTGDRCARTCRPTCTHGCRSTPSSDSPARNGGVFVAGWRESLTLGCLTIQNTYARIVT